MATHSPIQSSDDAITRGIKSVAIGKKGSKPLEPKLIADIIKDLKAGSVSSIAKGAFYGALMLKGITDEEQALEEPLGGGTFTDKHKLIEAISPDTPGAIKAMCARLLAKETLDVKESEELGDFLFSDQPGEGARGTIASILRVRYETADEYQGLLLSLHKTIDPAFKKAVPKGPAIVQFAEPFDGVDHSNLITPLIAQFVQRLNYRAVSLVGRNSGPKFGNNLLDLARAINGKFLFDADELAEEIPTFGWYLNQQVLSKPLDHWVERRHQTVKRPFLSTIERFINPLKARIMIASAFHPPYGEKMLTVCEREGFPGSIIVRNGLEGTLAFPLMRSAKILCSAMQADGNYKRMELVIDPDEHLDKPVKVEERLDSPSLEKNRGLIEAYARNGKTDYDLFDARIKFTCIGIKKAVSWIEQTLSGKGL